MTRISNELINAVANGDVSKLMAHVTDSLSTAAGSELLKIRSSLIDNKDMNLVVREDTAVNVAANVEIADKKLDDGVMARDGKKKPKDEEKKP